MANLPVVKKKSLFGSCTTLQGPFLYHRAERLERQISRHLPKEIPSFQRIPWWTDGVYHQVASVRSYFLGLCMTFKGITWMPSI